MKLIILIALAFFLAIVHGLIEVQNPGKRTTPLEVKEYTSFGTFSEDKLPKTVYLFEPNPRGACDILRKLPEYDNGHNIFDVYETNREKLGWICMINSDDCPLGTKIKISYGAGCNYLIIEMTKYFKVPFLKEAEYRGRVNVSFVTEESGELLREFAYPNRYGWRISTEINTE